MNINGNEKNTEEYCPKNFKSEKLDLLKDGKLAKKAIFFPCDSIVFSTLRLLFLLFLLFLVAFYLPIPSSGCLLPDARPKQAFITKYIEDYLPLFCTSSFMQFEYTFSTHSSFPSVGSSPLLFASWREYCR